MFFSRALAASHPLPPVHEVPFFTPNVRPVFLVICIFDLANEFNVYVVGLCRGGRRARVHHLRRFYGRGEAEAERQTRSFAQDLVTHKRIPSAL